METNKCCICGVVFKGFGNNPYPLRDDGRCCDECNSKYVIYARIMEMRNEPYRRLETWVELYDKDDETFVYGEYNTEKEAKEEMRIWNLSDYAIRHVAAEVINGDYITFAYANSKKELKEKIEKHYGKH